eukprot:4801336-Ditylum_brightwellii.AAC.1
MSILLKQNNLHLHQAFDTPFTSRLLKDCIGNFSIGEGAQKILDGDFDPILEENLPALTMKVIKALCHVQDETTSSSLSGRHYGHYNAAIKDDVISQIAKGN